ncbi:MAG: hypothetical protein JWP02_2769, partial [Acidimicrobiales bacterium]|nr:hypothetical protein [Acidimicrobiales bacterium]
ALEWRAAQRRPVCAYFAVEDRYPPARPRVLATPKLASWHGFVRLVGIR